MVAIKMMPSILSFANTSRFSVPIMGLRARGLGSADLVIVLMENEGFIVERFDDRVFIVLPQMWTLTLELVTSTYDLYLLRDATGAIRGEIYYRCDVFSRVPTDFYFVP